MKTARVLRALGLGLLLMGARPVDAAFDPQAPFSTTNGASIPVTGVAARSTSSIFGGISLWNDHGATEYLMIFNTTTQPTNGTAPLWVVQCAATQLCNTTTPIPEGGIVMPNGIFLIFSTTPTTLTAIGSASAGWYVVAYR